MNETEEAEEVEEAASKDPIIERKWKDARVERVRRGAERSFYQELSRYYLPTKRHWTRPQLLSKGKLGCTQYIVDLPLTYFLISGGRFGDTPGSQMGCLDHSITATL